MDNQLTNDSNEPKSKKHKRIPLATKITAKVMTESGFSFRDTAKELDVSLDTVQRAVKDATLDRTIIEKVKDNLPNKLYLLAFRIADRLLSDPTLIDKMNPYMSSLVMAIMVDKARLMSNQSTENIAVKGTVTEIQATLQTIREMRAKLSANVSQEGNSVPTSGESQEPMK